MRKTVRATMRALLKSGGAGVAPGGLTEGVLREMISGAVPAGSSGASAAALVTLEPRQRRKLPYTFNAALREQRLAQAVEDDTDDEADVAAKELEVDSEAEERGGEPEQSGAATAGRRALIRDRVRGTHARAAAAAAAAAGAGGMDVEGEEGGAAAAAAAAVAAEEEAAAVAAALAKPVQSGRKMAPEKPAGKRDMSAEFYEYAMRDIINPRVSGFYAVPEGKRKKARAARRGAKKPEPLFAPSSVPHVRQ